MSWIVYILAFIIVLGYILVVIYAYSHQMIFEPKRHHINETQITHKKIMIENRLSAWHFNDFPGRKTILFCHGNYGNISYFTFFAKLCHRHKINLLLFDYSGFGQSTGIPTQYQICRDGISAYNYLVQTEISENIIVWGMSMGGAVATYIAENKPCFNLVLMSTFSSIDDIVGDSDTSQFIKLLIRGISMVVDSMPSKQRIKNVHCPIAILHSKTDGLIPFQNALRLYQNIHHTCKKFIEIGGSHTAPIITDDHIKDVFSYCACENTVYQTSDDILESLRYINSHFEKLEARLQIKHNQ